MMKNYPTSVKGAASSIPPYFDSFSFLLFLVMSSNIRTDNGNIRTRAVLDRETSLRYWLTVIAQDRGAVPLTSRLDVYIEVEDENDNIPLTFEPVYYPNIPENSPEGTTVVKMEAFDLDVNPDQRISYHITAGDPQGYFALDSATGKSNYLIIF
ncbi:Protocadherin Fat 1 [Araneus ventricosus]|uniref:Protocadherin Fat 1 n=1 Tax=Araneus ventricosus TaxID=182803 RepID=A0A4Y1ZXJ6_ARAVE|nr:Protocadherin Fat 1 [Araneus ventricosus]